MKSTEKSLSFFRVFDLAFFAPGVVLALTLALLFHKDLDFSKIQAASIEGVLFVIVLIGFIYVLGLINFSIMWKVFKRWLRKKPGQVKDKNSSQWAPFPMLFENGTQDELILYFWYLRATCLGLASAFGISFLAIGICFLVQNTTTSNAGNVFTDHPKLISFLLAFEMLGAVFLTIQGANFNKGIEQCLKKRNEEYYASSTKPISGSP